MCEEGSIQLKPTILFEYNDGAEVKSRPDRKGKAKTKEHHPYQEVSEEMSLKELSSIASDQQNVVSIY